jgi:hypothetical protein
MAFGRPLAIALLGAALAGCGGSGGDEPKQSRPAATGEDPAIRDAVIRSYTSTDARDCTRVFTAAFIQAAYQGVAGCRMHMREKAKLPPRTVRIIRVHREGPVADARIRVDNFDTTVKLVLTGRQWQVDDTVGAQGSARTNLSQSRAAAAAREQAKPPVALRESVRFRPIAGIGPRMNFSVTVVRVVASGHARNGVRSATGPLVDDFGTVTNKRVRYRVVNVLVRLRNHGPAPFRGTFSAFVIGSGGRTWPAARHAGRLPDWSDGERQGIAPGDSVTRWVTVAMPARGRPRTVELRPEVLSAPNTVAAVEPDRARWRAR